MTPQKQLETHRKYYQTAWAGLKDELQELLIQNGFKLDKNSKKGDIGNKHGEVYADTDEVTKKATCLHQLRIAPTQTGALEVKSTFEDVRSKRVFTEKVKAKTSAVRISNNEKKNDQGRYEITYYFLGKKPDVTPEDAKEILLAATKNWFDILKLMWP